MVTPELKIEASSTLETGDAYPFVMSGLLKVLLEPMSAQAAAWLININQRL
jgi:hypothetical protein